MRELKYWMQDNLLYSLCWNSIMETSEIHRHLKEISGALNAQCNSVNDFFDLFDENDNVHLWTLSVCSADAQRYVFDQLSVDPTLFTPIDTTKNVFKREIKLLAFTIALKRSDAGYTEVRLSLPYSVNVSETDWGSALQDTVKKLIPALLSPYDRLIIEKPNMRLVGP